MGWLTKVLHSDHSESSGSASGSSSSAAPPAWATATEHSYANGRYTDASENSFTAGESFCMHNPVFPPALLPSDVVDRINAQGCAAWGLTTPLHRNFVGRVGPSPSDSKGQSGVVTVVTDEKCDDACLMSDLPIMAGLYAQGGKEGVYFEITIREMNGTIAIGTAVRPYPDFRLPGWNRLSMALHLDDLRKFCENPDGGQDYDFPRIQPGDSIGCGLSFSTSQLFFTHNGARMHNAFSGLYVPQSEFDVFAAIGVCGRNTLEVNFGATLFRWKEGNEWAWRVEGHVGRLSGPSGGPGDELPSYSM